MLKGQLVFAQLTAHLPRSVFNASAARYAGRYPTLSFSHWDQFLCMTFAQLTSRASLRDITTCLRSHSAKLYFAGFRGAIARSTLADANERRDSRIFEEFALRLIEIARRLYSHDSLGEHLAQSVYAIDATTIDLCLSLFSWAPAANARAGVKLHTLLDLRGNIPSVVRITSTLTADVTFLDHLPLEAGSFYVMDRGYVHFARLMKFTRAAAFFVTRSKRRIAYQAVTVHLADAAAGVLRDESILLTGRHGAAGYAGALRRIEFKEPVRGRILVFLTNNFELHACQIAQLYKSRWQVELFFKWIKQHLRIKAFIGNSANAVKVQIWTAISTYVLVAIIKKRLNVRASLHAMLQILSLNLFEKVPLEQLLCEAASYEESDTNPVQLGLL
jgi:hypothetical protein